MAKKKRLITNGYVVVCDENNLEKAELKDYDYEHRMIAEEILDRPLKEGEVVHHLDKNRANNSPDNLLVLSGPMHAKLHTWMDKNVIIPKPEYQKRINKGCIRCKVCDKPIDDGMVYCSTTCYQTTTKKVERPDRQTLEKLTQEFPMTKLGQQFGVSDNAIKKWCKSMGIELGDRRGHWVKKKFNKII